MDNKNLVELIDDDSNKIFFDYIMTIDFGEKEYVVLTPMTSQVEVVQNNYEDQVVILRVEHDTNQENIYVSIDDEDELNEVFEAFCEIVTQSDEEDP